MAYFLKNYLLNLGIALTPATAGALETLSPMFILQSEKNDEGDLWKVKSIRSVLGNLN